MQAHPRPFAASSAPPGPPAGGHTVCLVIDRRLTDFHHQVATSVCWVCLNVPLLI